MAPTLPPPEPVGGQDMPPDVPTAIRSVVGLLADVDTWITTHADPDDPDDALELLLRIKAHRSALRRLFRHLTHKALP